MIERFGDAWDMAELNLMRQVRARANVLGGFLGLVWVVSGAVLILSLDSLIPVLIPRTSHGLLGVLTMPFVHASWTHLVVNTLPLATFAWLVLIRGPIYFARVTIFIALVGGLGVWVFARSAAHVGASGLIFGYFGFLVARGLYDRQLRSIAIALGVAFVYGSMIGGVLPGLPQVSWEGHLAGLLAGVLAARVLDH